MEPMNYWRRDQLTQEMSDSYLLLIDKSLRKELQKFPAKQYKQVVTKLLSLAVDPKSQDCKALKGVDRGYRVDRGEYRILYYLTEPEDEPLGQVQIFALANEAITKSIEIYEPCLGSRISRSPSPKSSALVKSART